MFPPGLCFLSHVERLESKMNSGRVALKLPSETNEFIQWQQLQRGLYYLINDRGGKADSVWLRYGLLSLFAYHKKIKTDGTIFIQSNEGWNAKICIRCHCSYTTFNI